MDPVAVIAVIGSFVASISALILGLAGIIAQNKRDNKQSKIDQDKSDKQSELDKGRLDIDREKATEESYQTMLESLRAEVARLRENETRDRTRIQELETSVIDKTTKIGDLMLAKIDAESETATMRYKMEAMQTKLNMLLKIPEIPEPKKRIAKKEETLPIPIKKVLLANEFRKTKVVEEMNHEIEKFKISSITNGDTYLKGE